ncbi:MAG: efflux RND transporter periplasmic adaptor subunit [Longimicrobiales bacterium]
MGSERLNRSRVVIRSVVLLMTIIAVGGGLVVWKYASERAVAEAAASQPEPMEVVTQAVAGEREHRGTVTSIGTVLAMRSVTLRNELPGTVHEVRLLSGQVVSAGALLVALDVSVEAAELKALEARAELAETTLARYERMAAQRAVSAIELDNARAERDVARAEIERTRAIIGRKTIRAPFRARIGIADVHRGQFLDAGTLLTTLQGVDEAVHVDFAVAQGVAAGLGEGDAVEVFAGVGDGTKIAARIVAIDARVDPATRNATVRARIEGGGEVLVPGASVRVRIPVGASQVSVVVPVNALRKGPAGDHVFVLEEAEADQTRAHVRPVEAGPVIGDEVVILQGLSAGERVAASGSFKLRDAALVRVANETAGALSAR